MSWKLLPIMYIETQDVQLPEEITNSLTEKQLRFIREYAVDFNGEQAAIRAGYSPNGARVQASLLLTNINIKRGIREIAEANCRISADVTRERIILELARMSFYNPTDFMEWSVDENGREIFRLKDSSLLTDAQAACIQSVTQTNAGISIKFHDKKGSLELLARHLGMLNDKLNVNVAGTVTHSVEHNYSLTQKIIETNPDLIQTIFANGNPPELVEAEIVVDNDDGGRE